MVVKFKKTQEMLLERATDFSQSDKQIIRYWKARYKVPVSPYFAKRNLIEEAIKKAPKDRQTLLNTLIDISTTKVGLKLLMENNPFALSLMNNKYKTADYIYRLTPILSYKPVGNFKNGFEFAAYLYSIKKDKELEELLVNMARTSKSLITTESISYVGNVNYELGTALKLAKIPRKKTLTFWEKVKAVLSGLLSYPKSHQDMALYPKQ